MSLAILFQFLRTQHVSDINISIIRSLLLVLQASACNTGTTQAVLQPAIRALLKTSRTKSPTHNELRTKRPMW